MENKITSIIENMKMLLVYPNVFKILLLDNATNCSYSDRRKPFYTSCNIQCTMFAMTDSVFETESISLRLYIYIYISAFLIKMFRWKIKIETLITYFYIYMFIILLHK